MKKGTIVSEYVAFGHPDKIADQISDALLDEFIKVDKNTKAGIEVLVKDNVVVLGGEVKCNGIINCEAIVKDVFSDLSFPESHNLSSENIKVINLIGKQSLEINKGVEQGDGIIGAGDQGFMVGFASNETKDFLPLGVYISKKICEYVASFRDGIGPDVKSQVIVDYSDGYPKLKHILVSTMHQKETLFEIRSLVRNIILTNKDNFLCQDVYDKHVKNNELLSIDVNPCGSWGIGGPISDCGVTGRKIVVDQFGGYSNVGGGCLHGKDSSKVDRSAAYMSRYIAKNIVGAGICNTCKVTLSYMIGIPEPSSIDIELDNNTVDVKKLIDIIYGNIDLTPSGIQKRFDMLKPIYRKTAVIGHYGVNDYKWESLDFVDILKNKMSN
jgi:S-adenosylmethionine synthetase